MALRPQFEAAGTALEVVSEAQVLSDVDPDRIEQVLVNLLGLGLFISRQIVESHRGKIWVESKLNQGRDVRGGAAAGGAVKRTSATPPDGIDELSGDISSQAIPAERDALSGADLEASPYGSHDERASPLQHEPSCP